MSLDPAKKTEAYTIDIVSAIAAACTVAPGIKIVDQGKKTISRVSCI